jgi:hypothetical protein
MEFHLPFFVLRKATETKVSTPRARGKWLRGWEELTLLIRDKTPPGNQEIYRLHKAQISCVIYGCDEWQWAAYVFEDTEYESGHNGNNVVNSRELHDGAATRGTDEEDPILCRSAIAQPIWRPRQYFLRAFEMQVRKCWTEWKGLVHLLEADRIEYVCFHSPNFE